MEVAPEEDKCQVQQINPSGPVELEQQQQQPTTIAEEAFTEREDTRRTSTEREVTQEGNTRTRGNSEPQLQAPEGQFPHQEDNI